MAPPCVRYSCRLNRNSTWGGDGEQRRYSLKFKNRAVTRLLPPESAAVELVAREIGIGAGTLERWRDAAQFMSGHGRAWTAATRLEAVVVTAALDESSKNAWCRDMTYLPAQVAGRWFYLYIILDLYSRKIVGWEVHDSDHADHAVHLVSRTTLAEGVAALASKPVLHGDNGSTLKATTVLAMLNWLGIKPSYSRPRVSDDNAYAEPLFRTAKYRPEFPAKGLPTSMSPVPGSKLGTNRLRDA